MISPLRSTEHCSKYLWYPLTVLNILWSTGHLHLPQYTQTFAKVKIETIFEQSLSMRGWGWNPRISVKIWKIKYWGAWMRIFWVENCLKIKNLNRCLVPGSKTVSKTATGTKRWHFDMLNWHCLCTRNCSWSVTYNHSFTRDKESSFKFHSIGVFD